MFFCHIFACAVLASDYVILLKDFFTAKHITSGIIYAMPVLSETVFLFNCYTCILIICKPAEHISNMLPYPRLSGFDTRNVIFSFDVLNVFQDSYVQHEHTYE